MRIQSIQTNFISQISHSLHFFYIGKKPSEFSKIIFFPTCNIPNILEFASNRINSIIIPNKFYYIIDLLRYMNVLIQLLAYLRILQILSIFACWEKKYFRKFWRFFSDIEKVKRVWDLRNKISLNRFIRCACFPKIRSTISFLIFAESQWEC